MKLKHLTTSLIAAMLLTSCQEAEEQSQQEPPAPMTDEERQHYVDRGKAAIGDLANTLGSRLKEEIEKGGPVSAVKACHEIAQSITKEVTDRQEGITISRTTLRYRNPVNAPDEADLKILESWQSRKDQGEILPDHELVQLDQDKVRFYKPIMLQPICLNCHGPEEQLLPELKTVLDELYPEDKARNFQVGDLRGVFRVEMETASVN